VNRESFASPRPVRPLADTANGARWVTCDPPSPSYSAASEWQVRSPRTGWKAEKREVATASRLRLLCIMSGLR